MSCKSIYGRLVPAALATRKVRSTTHRISNYNVLPLRVRVCICVCVRAQCACAPLYNWFTRLDRRSPASDVIFEFNFSKFSILFPAFVFFIARRHGVSAKLIYPPYTSDSDKSGIVYKVNIFHHHHQGQQSRPIVLDCLLGLYWTGLTLLNGFSFLVNFLFFFILGRAVD